MELKEAMEILERHNKWRRGAEIPQESPGELGIAIDTVLEAVMGNGLLPCVSRRSIGLFMLYDNGDMVNIQDLPKPEYEKFLEQMNVLRMAYIAKGSRP